MDRSVTAATPELTDADCNLLLCAAFAGLLNAVARCDADPARVWAAVARMTLCFAAANSNPAGAFVAAANAELKRWSCALRISRQVPDVCCHG